MKNELRIGNIVMAHRHIGAITEIGEVMKGNSIIDGEEWSFSLSMNYINPVPLTEKWLKRFGAVYKEKHDHFDLNGYTILCMKNECIILNCGNDLSIEYVHQLQNLYFVLTGEELTYE